MANKLGQRNDSIYLETLAASGEIVSMVSGRFISQNIETIILGKV